VLHTWGSALTHHPHAHIIVPGGGFSSDGKHWIACRPGFFLSVRVLSGLFRRLFLEGLSAAYQAGRLQFFADQAALAEPAASKPTSPHCASSNDADEERNPCPCCGGRMIIVETFDPGCQPRFWPVLSIRLDSS
jgi:hypothetical protein